MHLIFFHFQINIEQTKLNRFTYAYTKERHIKKICRKERIARNAKKIWNLGDKLCTKEFRRRWILFKYLVHSTMSYRVKVCGWDEKEELEKLYKMDLWFRILYTEIYYKIGDR